MSVSYISPELREIIEKLAKHLCEYCQTQEIIIGMRLEVEHIIPETLRGETIAMNLCLACSRCNRYKGTQTHAIDEQTGEMSPLFNPRQQKWEEHFSWSENGLYIVGLTPVGRATVKALQVNNPFVIRSRQIWREWGWHPPAK